MWWIGVDALKPHGFFILYKMVKTYSEKLKDPRWQKKRLEVLSRDNFTCQLCNDTKETLQIHHLKYIRGNEPWEYDLDNFKCLCESCHKTITLIIDFDFNKIGKVLKKKSALNNYNNIYFTYKHDSKIIAIMGLSLDPDFKNPIIHSISLGFLSELNTFFNGI